MSYYILLCFRYTVAQRSDARHSLTRSPGLPPYCLTLSRLFNPFSPPETTTSTGLEIRAADLHSAHRGSRQPAPAIASGEFIYHTAGAPPNDLPLFTHGDHQHQFILEWEYDTEGKFVLSFGFFGFLGVLYCRCVFLWFYVSSVLFMFVFFLFFRTCAAGC